MSTPPKTVDREPAKVNQGLESAAADVLGCEAGYAVAVRSLCEFGAKTGDLDVRFTPSPTAQQGREGHVRVAQNRPAGYASEVSLSGVYQCAAGVLRVTGRADGFDAKRNQLEEFKTFKGLVQDIAPNQRALHWAQLKVYGWLMCQQRGLPNITLNLVYFDVLELTEHTFSEVFSAPALQAGFDALCAAYVAWAGLELQHRQARDRALQDLVFPLPSFRTGQHDMASAVYRACVQSKTLMVQAPTGIGKTLGVVFPALRAMPERGVDKLFFLTAKTPGRAVALAAVEQVGRAQSAFPLRVLELVAKSKACEYPDKACHGQSCPLARGFYDRLALARQAAAATGWLDQAGLRTVALSHGVCPYYLGQEMARWADVVIGDYNYYFDRTAMLYAMAVEGSWRVTVLVDEAHNLYQRCCTMYSAALGQAECAAARPELPAAVRQRLDMLQRAWSALNAAQASLATESAWAILDAMPSDWLQALQRLNAAFSEHLSESLHDPGGAALDLFFKTLAFANLAEEFGQHSLCEWDATGGSGDHTGKESGVFLRLRNIVPAEFIRPRLQAADSLVLFSATLCPREYFIDLLGLPDTTEWLDVPCPFDPAQLQVRIVPLSTRRGDRTASLDAVVDAMAQQFDQKGGNYLAFFSSFDYLALALERLQQRHRHRHIAVWAQQRQMDEAERQRFLHRFEVGGQGIGFAVLGGVFGEGVDLAGTRLIGAFVATLGLPQFDALNQAICQRLQARFGRGHDYTYRYPGLQKVVQAAGRVIRAPTDTGTVLLLDDRYRQARYRRLLPSWWQVATD